MRTALGATVGALLVLGCVHAFGDFYAPSNPDMAGYVREADLPKPSSAMPPATDIGGAPGASTLYARADHTHATSVQRRRWPISVAGQPNEWTFGKPYESGVVPVVTCTAENVAGATRPFVVNTIGAPTNTSVKVAVFQAAQPTVSLLGINLTLFGQAGAGTVVNCQAAKGTQ